MVPEPGECLFEALHQSHRVSAWWSHDILGPEGRKGTAPFDHLLNDFSFLFTTWLLWVQERRVLYQFLRAAITN